MENGSSVLILLLFLTCSAPLSSAGVHTLQRIYGCERDDDTTRGYDVYSYDGKHFISLDLKTGTWTAAKDKAEIFINEWDPTGDRAKQWKDFLQKDCIDQLQMVLYYSKETLERKDSDSRRVAVSNTERPSEVTSSSTDGPASEEAETEHTVIRLNSLPDTDSESVRSCGSRRRCRTARDSSFL